MIYDELVFLADKNALSPAVMKKIKGKNWQWIQTDPLFMVAMRLLVISHVQQNAINSVCLALLAKRLITSELAVGGPYSDTTHPDIATNIALAQFLTSLGEVPTPLAAFIADHNHRKSDHLPKSMTAWLLTWPHDLTSQSQMPRMILAGEQTPQYHHISKRVLNTIRSLKEPLQNESYKIWQSVNQANRNLEITHIATYFAHSLANPPKHETKSLYDDLGEANFYAWMAYTIYDDFIDGKGHGPHLNVANAMHRRSLLLYAKHAPTTINTWQYFDQMDEANAWELAHCRAKVTADILHLTSLPNYRSLSTLAARSSAHILGPLILTAATNSHYETFRVIEQGLRHFLIARQLSDDLHDWKKDLRRGHLSPVVSHLLEKTNNKKGRFIVSSITPVLQRYFWQNGATTINRRILYHTKKSRRLLTAEGFMNNDTPFFINILLPLEASTKQAMTMHQEHKKFLATYQLSQ